MKLIKQVNDYFKSLQLECEDIQMNEPSVGISAGWVTFTDNETNEHLVTCWDDAVWWMENEGNRSNVLSDSEIDFEYYS